MDVDLLKIDVPQNATKETDWRVTSLANQSYFRAKIESPTLDSSLSDGQVKVSVDYDLLDKTSDIYALQVDQVVSVTPLSLDFTSRIERSSLHTFIKDDSEVN